MYTSATRSSRTWLVLLIALVILPSGLWAVFGLGQGGTGRETPKANSNKKPSASKQKRPSRKPTSTSRSTEPANRRAQQRSDEEKSDEATANERTYWETIRLSTNAEDFKLYLEKYPNGQFATLALSTLGRLETAGKPADKTNSNSNTPYILGSISGLNSGPAPKPGSLVRNQIGMELVYVPAGTFMMGSNNGEADEQPLHKVTIKEGFYMGRYEVTQAEWQKVMGTNPSGFKGDRLPVNLISWDDAQSFISKLSQRQDGFKYRLPTEAEWEYACRAGTTGAYAGDLDKMAWYANNSGKQTHPVGTKQPNAFGLYDMHGNAWEWCQDAYHKNYEGAPADGSPWLSGGVQGHRVLRGGSGDFGASILRSATRSGIASGFRYNNFGFRVVAIKLNY